MCLCASWYFDCINFKVNYFESVYIIIFFFAGYNVYVVQDATRGVEEGTTVSAVREMKDQGQLRSGHAP